jgi:hypothetical protein
MKIYICGLYWSYSICNILKFKTMATKSKKIIEETTVTAVATEEDLLIKISGISNITQQNVSASPVAEEQGIFSAADGVLKSRH